MTQNTALYQLNVGHVSAATDQLALANSELSAAVVEIRDLLASVLWAAPTQVYAQMHIALLTALLSGAMAEAETLVDDLWVEFDYAAAEWGYV